MSVRARRFRATDGIRPSQGFVLVVALLILVVMTLLSISMFRSFGLQERIAGNTREKQRALESAQSALQYGEWWLDTGKADISVVCEGKVANANDLAQMRICKDPVERPDALPWAWRAEYLPSTSMSVDPEGGVKSNDINYWGKPGLHIYFVGMAPPPNPDNTRLFQVTAYGHGGSASTAAVVQSIFQIKSDGTRQLDGP